MSMMIPGNKKHLTLEDRRYIEKSLYEKKSFREISRYLCKDPTTISKEVSLHRRVDVSHYGSFNNPYNFCIHRFHCKKINACRKVVICDMYCRSCHICNRVCPHFEREQCSQIEKAPFVCNGCSNPRNLCTVQTKYYYDAAIAQRKYSELLVSSRSGVNLTKQALVKINKVVQPLTAQGQSPYMIVANHPELGLSVKTLYNYTDKGLFLIRNIDLKRKPGFKKRKCHKTQITDRNVFTGRTYQDFKTVYADDDMPDFVEMDTVKSAKGSFKCILTLYFPQEELLYAHLLDRCTPGAVRAVYDKLEDALGDGTDFMILFLSVLTDRGVEFGDPEGLENDRAGCRRTHIYYCDPMRSNQKAGIENVHIMLWMILPKGTVFEGLTQWDLRRCVDHINNSPKRKLNGRFPYQMALGTIGEETLNKLQLRYIAPDEVTLSPKLLQK